jgi:RNase P/RNase MRP subunit p30
MKNPVDLHLNLTLEKKMKAEQMIKQASELGYKSIGVPIHPRASSGQRDWLKKICVNFDLDLITRVDLIPKSPKNLLEDLRRLRRKFELIAVNCWNKPIARQAAKDHRVDLLVFLSTEPKKRFFDIAEARLAFQGLAALEVGIAPLLRYSGFHRVRLLSCLRREIAIAKKLKIPIVVCSDANNSYEMRGPHELACLTTLFDMEGDMAKKAITNVPMEIVRRNRKKLDPDYVAGDIHIIKRGEKCKR